MGLDRLSDTILEHHFLCNIIWNIEPTNLLASLNSLKFHRVYFLSSWHHLCKTNSVKGIVFPY